MGKFIEVIGGTQEDLYKIINRDATDSSQIPAHIYYLRKSQEYDNISAHISGDSALISHSYRYGILVSKPLGPYGLDMLVDVMKNDNDPNIIYDATGLSFDQMNVLLKNIGFEPRIKFTRKLVNYLPLLSLEGSESGNLRRSLSRAEKNNLSFKQYNSEDFTESIEIYHAWMEHKNEEISNGPFGFYNREEMEEMLKDFKEIPGFSIYKVVNEKGKMVFVGGVFVAAKWAFPTFRLKSSENLRQSEYHDYNLMIKLKDDGVIMFNWGASDSEIGGKMDSYKEKFRGGIYIEKYELFNPAKLEKLKNLNENT